MIATLKKLFGGTDTIDYGKLITEGALILDVRSGGEFASGHIGRAMNIPLDQLERNLSKLGKNQLIITCCASGMRSSSAKSLLESKGFTNVYNAGSWMSLKRYDNNSN
jgi:rhodanese-related sulfurtransferase